MRRMRPLFSERRATHVDDEEHQGRPGTPLEELEVVGDTRSKKGQLGYGTWSGVAEA